VLGPVVRATKSCPVNLVKDDHPSLLSTDTRELTTAACTADPGYRIVDARFNLQSDTRASGPSVSIAADRQSASLSSRLTSGPATDQYRAWLIGQLELSQEEDKQTGDEVLLANGLKATDYKTYLLKSDISLDQIRSLRVTVDGRSFTLDDPSKAFILPGIDGQVALVQGDQGLGLGIQRAAAIPN
jgi:hypothetical protein